MNGFTGVYTAIVTPFKDGKIDYDSYKKLVDFQIDGGVDGIVPCGTTGESPTLSHAEHSELISKTVEFAGGRCKVIAGAGSNATAEAIRLSQAAEKDGADGLLQVNPYYNKPTQAGLKEHFKAIAESVKIPVVLYNIPGRTAISLSLDTIIELSQVPNITSVKEATGDVSIMADIAHNTGDDFTVLSGDDNLTLPCLSVGGSGVVSVISNLFPAEVKAITNAWEAGDIKAAQKAFFHINGACQAMFLETNPIPIKKAMELKGHCSGDVRLPLTELDPALVSTLKKAIEL